MFNNLLTFFCLLSSTRKRMIGAEQERKEVEDMNGTNWSSLADLEDLIYENQKTVASER